MYQSTYKPKYHNQHTNQYNKEATLLKRELRRSVHTRHLLREHTSQGRKGLKTEENKTMQPHKRDSNHSNPILPRQNSERTISSLDSRRHFEPLVRLEIWSMRIRRAGGECLHVQT